jgi:DNA-binding SARP family transcriptional activator
MTIRLVTLGGLRALAEDRELDWLPAQRLRAAILVYLATERRVSRDTLISTIWPESDDKNARHALRQSLHNLGKSLGKGWFKRTAIEIRATESLCSDVHEFENALARGDHEAAAALYRGPFLAGVHLLNVRPWEDWVETRRAAVARAFRQSCRNWVNGLTQSGDLAGAVAAARQWVSPDPFDDEAQHRLIECLAAAGDRSEALRQYEAYLRLLEGDGLQPLDGTKALYAQLRSSQPAQAIKPVLGPTGGSPPPAVTPAPQPQQTAGVESGDGHSAPPIPEPHTPTDVPQPPVRPPDRRPKRLLWLAPALVVAALAISELARNLWDSTNDRSTTASDAPAAGLDRMLYVLFPLQGDSTGIATLILRDAIEQRWTGIEVVDQFTVAGAIDRLDATEVSSSVARQIATLLGAGRYMRGDVTPLGTAVRVAVTLYDTRTSRQLADTVIRITPELLREEQAFAKLADALLLGDAGSRRAQDEPGTTRSFPAEEAYARGVAAVRAWDLARADSAFDEAFQLDTLFARAMLWLTQVRVWSGEDPSRWLTFAQRAAGSEQGRLTHRERALVRALLAYGGGAMDRACAVWDSLSKASQTDFVAWYSLAHCLNHDPVVLSDSRSPTGWRFRGSQPAPSTRTGRLSAFFLPCTGRCGEVPSSLSDRLCTLRRQPSSAGNAGQQMRSSSGRFQRWRAIRSYFILSTAATSCSPSHGSSPRALMKRSGISGGCSGTSL